MVNFFGGLTKPILHWMSVGRNVRDTTVKMDARKGKSVKK